MVSDFKDRGMLADALLTNILKCESKLPHDLALEILLTFHLICGPISKGPENHYIVPYFSTMVVTIEESGQYIPLKVEICFRGLSVPAYVYNLLTAAFLSHSNTGFNQLSAGLNGGCVRDAGGTIEYFLHNVYERTVTVLYLSPVMNVAESWMSLLSKLQYISAEIKLVWKGAKYETVFICSHCLLEKREEPAMQVDPNWWKGLQNSLTLPKENFPSYSGKETVMCCKGEDTWIYLWPHFH